jgi:hypothetical protein
LHSRVGLTAAASVEAAAERKARRKKGGEKVSTPYGHTRRGLRFNLRSIYCSINNSALRHYPLLVHYAE